jgi:hypothetical protein
MGVFASARAGPEAGIVQSSDGRNWITGARASYHEPTYPYTMHGATVTQVRVPEGKPILVGLTPDDGGPEVYPSFDTIHLFGQRAPCPRCNELSQRRPR